jgi:hypothetical protein
MAKFNEYPAKTTPKDADKFMLYSAEDAANKLIDYDKLADAVLNKLTSKTFGLDQGTMTLPAALNQLNSNQAITITSVKTSILKKEIALFKAGNIVVISYTGDTTDNVKQGNLQVIGTIPPDYVPRQRTIIAPIQSTAQRIQLTFDNNGNITAYNYGNEITAQTPCRYNGCYVC